MYVNRFGQRSLAWAMVDIAAPYLAPDDRSWLWVKIGAGDLESAVLALVGTCMRNDVPLPVSVTAALRDWLYGYSGTEVGAAFEHYVGGMPTAAVLPDERTGQAGSSSDCDPLGKLGRRGAVGSKRCESSGRRPQWSE